MSSTPSSALAAASLPHPLPPVPLCLLIGAPGAGKSTLMAAALAPAIGVTLHTPFAHVLYQDAAGYPSGAYLGKFRAKFPGTDTLSLSVQPLVLSHLAGRPWPAVAAEGDRLTNERFILAARDMGYDVDVVFLDTPLDVAARRREERGSVQSVPWVKGRVTKVHSLAAGMEVRRIDGSLPLSAQIAALRQSPAIVRLRAGVE